MPPRPAANRPGPTNTQTDAAAAAAAVDDTMDEDLRRTLRYECRALKKAIEREEVATGQYNDERLRINYFWLVAKKEKEDKEAELRNKNREH